MYVEYVKLIKDLYDIEDCNFSEYEWFWEQRVNISAYHAYHLI